MADERLHQFLTQIYSTNGAEIDCQRLQTLLPAYVDHVLIAENGAAEPVIAEDQRVAVQVHLEHCPDCNDVYVHLRQVVAAADKLPAVDDLLAGFEESVETAHSETAGELVRCSR